MSPGGHCRPPGAGLGTGTERGERAAPSSLSPSVCGSHWKKRACPRSEVRETACQPLASGSAGLRTGELRPQGGRPGEPLPEPRLPQTPAMQPHREGKTWGHLMASQGSGTARCLPASDRDLAGSLATPWQEAAPISAERAQEAALDPHRPASPVPAAQGQRSAGSSEVEWTGSAGPRGSQEQR